MGFLRYSGASHTLQLFILLMHVLSNALAKRHVVYWNSTNSRLTSDDYMILVNMNDYLDILCPHYSSPVEGSPENLALYLVAEHQFKGCHETKDAIKRWECNAPYAPYGPVHFTEKIQRFTPFTLGFEFLPGHHYYYSSLATDDGPPLPCMKLKVTVCCASTETAEQDQKQENPASRSLGQPGRSDPLLHIALSFLSAFLFL